MKHQIDLVDFSYLQFWDSHIHNKKYFNVLFYEVCPPNMTAGVRLWLGSKPLV